MFFFIQRTVEELECLSHGSIAWHKSAILLQYTDTTLMVKLEPNDLLCDILNQCIRNSEKLYWICITHVRGHTRDRLLKGPTENDRAL